MKVYIYYNENPDGVIAAATMCEFVKISTEPMFVFEDSIDLECTAIPTDALQINFSYHEPESLVILLGLPSYEPAQMYSFKHAIEDGKCDFWWFSNNSVDAKTLDYLKLNNKTNFTAILDSNMSLSELVYRFCINRLKPALEFVSDFYAGVTNNIDLNLDQYISRGIPELFKFMTIVHNKQDSVMSDFIFGFNSTPNINPIAFFNIIIGDGKEIFNLNNNTMQEKIKEYIISMIEKGKKTNP